LTPGEFGLDRRYLRQPFHADIGTHANGNADKVKDQLVATISPTSFTLAKGPLHGLSWPRMKQRGVRA
jgi:hypothetical protein